MLFERLLDLVVPPGCAACGAALRSGAPPLCAACARSLPWLRGTRCTRCGLPRHRGGGCPAAEAPFACAWSPVAYEGTARTLVAALKFRSRPGIADVLAAHLAANLPGDLRATEAAVVPVPAHPGRRRRRGFDPAEQIAVAFARRTERPIVRCLRRRDRLAPLKRATAAERAGGELRIEVCGTVPQAVLLVDDVHTTGATLRACADALRAGGCGWVAAVTYARTL